MTNLLEFKKRHDGSEVIALDLRLQALAAILSELNRSEPMLYILNELSERKHYKSPIILSDQVDNWQVEFNADDCMLTGFGWNDEGEKVVESKNIFLAEDIIKIIDQWTAWLVRDEESAQL